jgi:hypothetical protein
MLRSALRNTGVIPLLAWMVAAGALVVWLLSRSAAGRRMRQRSLRSLRRAIIGQDKTVILRVFGPPQASADFAALAPAILVAADRAAADTWYYKLHRGSGQALVVQFDRGIARRAELLRAPRKIMDHT